MSQNIIGNSDKRLKTLARVLYDFNGCCQVSQFDETCSDMDHEDCDFVESWNESDCEWGYWN